MAASPIRSHTPPLPSPRLLLVDTCGAEGRVALTAGDTVVAEAAMPGRTYSERLVAEGMRLLAEAGCSLRDLAAIVVVNGPGSFTGVRVGVSAAKGWSEAAAVPVIALSRLAILATATWEGATAALDAGRGEFYCRAGEIETLRSREQLLHEAAGQRVVVCEPAVALMLTELTPIMVQEPGPQAILKLAQQSFAAGQFADVATLDANYVRRSDAEIFAKPPVPPK